MKQKMTIAALLALVLALTALAGGCQSKTVVVAKVGDRKSRSNSWRTHTAAA